MQDWSVPNVTMMPFNKFSIAYLTQRNVIVDPKVCAVHDLDKIQGKNEGLQKLCKIYKLNSKKNVLFLK